MELELERELEPELEPERELEPELEREPERERELEPELELEREPEPERELEPELEPEPEREQEQGEPMTKFQFDKLSKEGFHPLPGRCVILLDQPPAKIGLIHIPDTARVQVVKAYGYMGKVLAVTPDHHRNPKYRADGQLEKLQWRVGDRVAVGLHMDDLQEEVVWARNGQVDAVIENYRIE